MRIQNFDSATHPEEFAQFERMVQCGEQGHGEVVIDAEGAVICRDCKALLDVISPEAIEEQKTMLAAFKLTDEERRYLEIRAKQRQKCRKRGHGDRVLKSGNILVCRQCGVDLCQEAKYERGEEIELGSLYPDLD